MRKVDALEKLLVSKFESTLIPVMKDNVIEVIETEDQKMKEDDILRNK
jgi:hypothetical protein